jgi:serine/threonine-protein kinase HipA
VRRGRVRLDGKEVGVLEELEGGGSRFTYDAAWLQASGAQPVSLTLPLREEPYVNRNVHPFFENLLPEGWLLEVSTAQLKLSKDDIFGLLLAMCRDCVGAVEILPMSGT